MQAIEKRDCGILSVDDFRNMIVSAEEKMRAVEGALVGDEAEALCPLKHSFGDSLYVREIFMPEGTLIISKIHRFAHPYFVLKGKASILTEEGVVVIEAPYQGMTKAGTKRALYIHEDMVWTTVHVTKETDLDKIDAEIIAKNFEEFEILRHNKEVLPCHT